MRRRAALAFIVLSALVAFSLPIRAAEFKAPVAKLELEDGDSVVFLGDSITHQCLYTQYIEDFFYTHRPEIRVKFHNAGVGGAKAWDALERFDRDVASYQPKYVTVLLGMNDGRYQPYDEETFQTYRRDMAELVRRITEIGATPVLMTPTMFDSRAARLKKPDQPPEKLQLYNSVLAYFGAWLREVAVDSGFGFVDMYSPLNNLTLAERKMTPDFTMIPDAVHPAATGQLVMAYAILDDLGLRGPLSTIRILPGKEGKPAVRAVGGQVSDLEVTDDGLEFAWLAKGLPLVVPEEAQLGAKLVNLGQRLNREVLEVHVLPPGRYALSIDGREIGVYGEVALSRRLELQSLAGTPQHEQALQVAELNKERNAGPVKSLRNEWGVFQSYSRIVQRLKDGPDDAKLKAQADSLKKRLEGMEDRIGELEKAARDMEDKIFAINQPTRRHFVLKRVAAAPKGRRSSKAIKD